MDIYLNDLTETQLNNRLDDFGKEITSLNARIDKIQNALNNVETVLPTNTLKDKELYALELQIQKTLDILWGEKQMVLRQIEETREQLGMNRYER